MGATPNRGGGGRELPMELVSWPGGSWEATARMVVAVVGIYLAAIWVTLIFWTYRDVRQRTRDPILQTVAVLLVLFFIFPGHWIYLILRPRYTLAEAYERSLEEEALLQDLEDQKSCPACKRRVYDDYLICPSCRTQLKEPCRQCSKPLSYAWVACPFCGLEKPPREGAGPRPARLPGRAPSPPPAVRRAPSTVQRSPELAAEATRARPTPAPGPAQGYASAPPPQARAEPAREEPQPSRVERGEERRTVTRPARATDPFATPRPIEATPRVDDDSAVIDATPSENGSTPQHET